MARIGEMIPSKYLKQSDIDDEAIATIRKIGKANIAQEDDPPEYRWLVRFDEFDKPMVLNRTNIEALADACGSDESDDWIGQSVVVYVDPNVSYAGKRTGGLRIKPARKTKQKSASADDTGGVKNMDDDIPF